MRLQNMDIRKAELRDLDSLIQIAGLCIKHLDSQEIYQWDEIYPSKKDFKEDIEKGVLYVILQNSIVQGCICINEVEIPGYEQANWDGKKFCVIHKLMVNPNSERNGFGRALMEFAERQAKENLLDSIRLDCFTQNKRANLFYQQYGYQKKGETSFRKGLFNLYEKSV